MSQSATSTASSKAKPEATTPMTYQDGLDEALEETFPASDPIAPSPASRGEKPIATPTNPVDWKVDSDDAKVKS